MMPLGRSLLGALGAAVLLVPATVEAQAPVPRHVDDLVSEVLAVIDEVRKEPPRRSASGSDGEAKEESSRTRDGGVRPFTRTMVNLLWRGLPLQREAAAEERPDRAVLMRLRPGAGGGRLQWTFVF
jgi:hypothetical protein